MKYSKQIFNNPNFEIIEHCEFIKRSNQFLNNSNDNKTSDFKLLTFNKFEGL